MSKINNFYELLPKHLTKKYHNPNFKKHMMKIPFRLLICGGSGAMKTNLLLEMIHRMSKTFENIVVCCKSKDEPLYQYLEEKAGDGVQFYEGGEVPDINDFKDYGQTLMVFDDLVLEKKQDKITEYFVRGRKVGGGISCVYISQSYFKTPKTIRINCTYIMLKKLSSRKDLNLILSDFALGVDPKQLGVLYKEATKDPLSFLMIDIEAPEEQKFRSGFLNILPVMN